jgi:hypothetical protein
VIVWGAAGAVDLLRELDRIIDFDAVGKSFRSALSIIASASSRFSMAFPASGPSSFCVRDVLAAELRVPGIGLAFDMTCLRHRSVTLAQRRVAVAHLIAGRSAE